MQLQTIHNNSCCNWSVSATVVPTVRLSGDPFSTIVRHEWYLSSVHVSYTLPPAGLSVTLSQWFAELFKWLPLCYMPSTAVHIMQGDSSDSTVSAYRQGFSTQHCPAKAGLYSPIYPINNGHGLHLIQWLPVAISPGDKRQDVQFSDFHFQIMWIP
jgi:hypothetical protein